MDNGTKVKREDIGLAHFMIKCENCPWYYEDLEDTRLGYKLARQHAKLNNHSLLIDKSRLERITLVK